MSDTMIKYAWWYLNEMYSFIIFKQINQYCRDAVISDLPQGTFWTASVWSLRPYAISSGEQPPSRLLKVSTAVVQSCVFSFTVQITSANTLIKTNPCYSTTQRFSPLLNLLQKMTKHDVDTIMARASGSLDSSDLLHLQPVAALTAVISCIFSFSYRRGVRVGVDFPI